jgi:hypothetical protein
MWSEELTDWILIVSGWVLAIGFFSWLGGVERAGEAIRHWGRSSARSHGPREER